MKKSAVKKSDINTRLFVSNILLLLFIIWLVFIEDPRQIDLQIHEFFVPFISSTTTAFMKAITFLGNHKFLIPANLLLIAVLLVYKKRKQALLVTIVALSSLGIMSILKNLFQRNRPENPLVEGITNYSFPSGHAFMSVVFFGLLLYLISDFIKIRWLRMLLTGMLIVLLLLIGVSRIYLNVHYPTDVIAGWLLGCSLLILFIAMFNKLYKEKTTSDN